MLSLSWVPNPAAAAATLPGSLVVTTTADFGSWEPAVDSFSSTNLVLFPGGVWNLPNRRDHGDIYTLSANSTAFMLLNSQIRGGLHTPTNWIASPANIGSAGSVGDNAWVGGGNTGIESDHARGDITWFIGNATLPDVAGRPWLSPPVVNKMEPDGYVYTYELNALYPWKISNLNGSIYVNSTNVMLWLTGTNSTVPSGGHLTVPSGSALSMWVDAPTFNVSGGGLVNGSGVAANLQYYGLSSNTWITLSGGANITAQIYAPQADLAIGTSGYAITNDFSGAIVAKSLQLISHFNFHLDEALGFQVYASTAPTLYPARFNGVFQFSLIGVQGFSYALQASTNMSDWTTLVTVHSPFRFVGPAGPSAQRFYRAVYLP